MGYFYWAPSDGLLLFLSFFGGDLWQEQHCICLSLFYTCWVKVELIYRNIFTLKKKKCIGNFQPF